MIIGVPKELKNNENRVGMTPGGVATLVKAGHEVWVETLAGLGSGFKDEKYLTVGAKMAKTHQEVFEKADMVVKVKEPISEEYNLIRQGQIIFTYFHFASNKELTEAMQKSGAICIAYETVEKEDRSLPLLIPMSEVAGRMSVQQGAKYLEKTYGGRGVLLGGIPGVAPGKVLIIGAGSVGTEAAKMAAGLGAQVTVLDTNVDRLRYLDSILPANVTLLVSHEHNIREYVKTHDLIIGAVLIHGAKAPRLITKDMLKDMRPGTVIVDVAIDQGGCIETAKPTTHENPTYILDGVVHYCVTNMPGAVPYTSTIALTNVTLPYVLQLANKGWKTACQENNELFKGLNLVEGKVVYQKIAELFGMPYSPISL